MKCRLRKDIKEFFLFILGMILLLGMGWVVCIIVGYIALQVFDLAIYSGYVTNPLDYYYYNGFGIVICGVLILGTSGLIIIPIYSAITYFKDNGMSWKSIKEIFLECE